MSESVLQKEFKEGDLQRIRNLVTKNYGEKTKNQIGYTKQIQDRKEGEVFTENNRTWIIKNGLKISFSKLDIIKKSLQIPLSCPCCSGQINKYIDKKMYFIHKKCFDCVIKHETKLRIEGKYEQYCQDLIKNNANFFLQDLESELNEFINNNMDTYITEQGDIEEWEGGKIDKLKIKQEIQEYINNVKSQLGV